MSKAQTEIVKVEVQQDSGLYHWRLFGLNLFAYKKVPCPIEQRPDVRFLTDLTARVPCAAHVGSLALKDCVDSPEEMFGAPAGNTPYTRTRVSFHDGFYDLDQWPCFDACFLPQVTPLFWQAMLKTEDDRKQMLLNHGLAFYVDPHPDTLPEMNRLLSAPFSGQAQWLDAVTRLYSMVLTVGHDGQYFHAFAQDRTAFHVLQPSLAAAVSAVESSEWFQRHKGDLVWDDEFDACLILPFQ